MDDQTYEVTYFADKGVELTDRTLALAKNRADKLGLKTVVLASTRGYTGARAVDVFRGYRVIVVGENVGTRDENTPCLEEGYRQAILAGGGEIVVPGHAFGGGVARAVSKRVGGQHPGALIANTLWIFGQGMKVAIEVVLMAADLGVLNMDEEVVSLGGTSRGCDTALVVKPAYTTRFFDLRVLEIMCKPRLA